MPSIKTLAITAAIAILAVVANEKGYLSMVGGAPKAKA